MKASYNLCLRTCIQIIVNSRSCSGEIAQLQSTSDNDYNNFSGNIKHVTHFKANKLKIYGAVSLIQSALRREGFGAFIVQSSDRYFFLFPLFSSSFLISWQSVVEF